MVRIVMRPLLAVCALVGPGVGCGIDTIEHEHAENLGGSTTLTSFTTAQGDAPSSSVGVFGDTNFPEPALTKCGGIDGLEPITHLRSAWAVVALPDAAFDDTPVEAGSIRLRFGEQPLFDCAQPFDTICGGGGGTSFIGTTGDEDECGWGFAFTLAPHEVSEGTLVLEELVDPSFELVLTDGPGAPEPVTGELEILSVTPECIVGYFVDVQTNEFHAPSFRGAFAAERCDRPCLPGPMQTCR